jgi:branched-chain amino acid transport system substrate-binding protein
MKRRLVILFGVVLALGLAIAAAGCGGGGEEGGGEATQPADTGAVADTGAAAGGGTTAESAGGEALNLRIGISAALSGPYAAYDVPLLNGMEFAAQEINAAGGPVTVEIVSKDNKGDQTQTLTTAQELLDDGVNVQVMTTADAGPAVAQLVSQAGAIISVGGNTAPAIVRDGGERVFAFVFGDNQQASAGAQYACDSGYKTAYTMGSPEIPYTKDMPAFFADAFAQICGGEIVGEDTFKIGQTEFGPQVTKIQNASPAPDVIFSPIFVPDSGAFLKQLRSAGVETPFITTDGNDSSLFVDSGGSAVDGTVYSTHGFASPGSEIESFINAYTEWKGEPPESNTFEAIGRDNIYALVQAAENAGSVEPDDVLAAVLELKDVPLLTGTMTMDPETRLPDKEITLVQMKGTEYTLLEKLIPSYIAPANG